MQSDINTRGYNQWFYFSIRNRQSRKVKIRVVNLVKETSLFTKGMKPAVFSYRGMKERQAGWERRGDRVQYGMTSYLRVSLV